MRHVTQYDCLVLQRVLETIIGNIVEVLPVVQESGTRQIYCRSSNLQSGSNKIASHGEATQTTVLIVTVTPERCQMDTNNKHGVLLQYHIERLRHAVESCKIDWDT